MSDSSDETISRSADQRIHDRCERLIRAWRDHLSGEERGTGPPGLRDYIGEASGSEARALFRELLDTDIHYRRKKGEQPSRKEYECRFAEYQDIVVQAFRLGHFAIIDELGRGAFGVVYRALDTQLQREVALKVPHASRINQPEDVEAYLREAQILASLDHPNIVPVHDFGQTDDGRCYVVSKLIDGQSLRERLDEGRPALTEAATIVATVAEALHYAHGKRLVHRDIKPANILIASSGTPHVADFGLAIRDVDLSDPRLQGGTPAYMSPEQADGEGHHVDPRSDIFSLGVVLYELLTGQRPFAGSSPDEVMDQIKSPQREAWLPSGFAPEIPQQLERICLKSLAKRRADRYPHAQALAEDLRHFVEQPSKGVEHLPSQPSGGHEIPVDNRQVATSPDAASPSGDPQSPRIVPKGLRSFDEDDADFFLDLLPGPRHPRDGLPESIRFWKTRIEDTDPDKTFSVGLIYGSSGCGKSSLVKAGLLPQLAPHVLPIYIEATAERTEVRLLSDLRKRCPALGLELDLTKTMAALRRGEGLPRGRKILIVLDQFEQWLHANRVEEDPELVRALRQCDGVRVQCIVSVRDDFSMAATRFLAQLEVDIVQGHNFNVVDLFSIPHTKKVLGFLGGANGDLPSNPDDLTSEQRAFLEQAAFALAEEGKVVCVRLALFADMMKGKLWTPASLKGLGGTQGLGVTFLDETFSSSAANPKHRYHQKGARAVLKALLPESGADIKGHMRSREDLLTASGYAKRPREFDDVLRILDHELRLITPTDPEGQTPDDEELPTVETSTGGRFYQLAHDYLVPSLRDWLTRKQKETRRGRAELLLAERAAIWRSKREDGRLPSWQETQRIRWLTRKKDWTDTQQQMMRRARRVHGVRWIVATSILLIVGVAFSWSVSKSSVSHLRDAKADAVPAAIESLRPFRLWAKGLIRQQLENASLTETQRLHLLCGLAEFGECDADEIVTLTREADRAEVLNIVRALANSKRDALSQIRTSAAALGKSTSQIDGQAKSRLAIVALYLDDPSLCGDMLKLRPKPFERTALIETLQDWHGRIDRLAAEVEPADDGAYRSGMALAIGSLPRDELDETDRQQWQALFSDWYVLAPDAGTHSAAGWALCQWSVPLPEIQATKEPVDNREWWRTPTGLTMLKIPAGTFERRDPKGQGKPQVVTLSRTCWLSDREITVGLFQQFIEDEEYRKTCKEEMPTDWEWEGVNKVSSPTPAHPASSVIWYDAVMFCNWLSRREGRTVCYERTGEKQPALGKPEEKPVWRWVARANGYRLPTEAEWEYACRAGTSTLYACGDEESHLARYAVFNANCTERAGNKLCNAWGLFDMHGSVLEWCQDWYGDYGATDVVDPMGPPAGSFRVHRGGCWSGPAGYCNSSCRDWQLPTGRYNSLGFRVALVPSASKQVSGAESGSR